MSEARLRGSKHKTVFSYKVYLYMFAPYSNIYVMNELIRIERFTHLIESKMLEKQLRENSQILGNQFAKFDSIFKKNVSTSIKSISE